MAEAVPLGAPLTRLARADPGRPAITSGGETISRAGLERRADQLACAYETRGVRPVQLVTVALPNGIGFYAATFALWKPGAVPQLVSSALPARERDAIIALAAPCGGKWRYSARTDRSSRRVRKARSAPGPTTASRRATVISAPSRG